ncbi:uncharacterized protein LOC144782986 [Lissotriton helveticus]
MKPPKWSAECLMEEDEHAVEFLLLNQPSPLGLGVDFKRNNSQAPPVSIMPQGISASSGDAVVVSPSLDDSSADFLPGGDAAAASPSLEESSADFLPGGDAAAVSTSLEDSSMGSLLGDDESSDSPPPDDATVSALSPGEVPPDSPYPGDTPACSPSPGGASADSPDVSESSEDSISPEPAAPDQTSWYYDNCDSPAKKSTCSVHNVNACNSSTDTAVWQRGSSIAFLREPKITSDSTDENGKSDDVVRATTVTPTWK